jgi:hypothetical protein
MSETRFTIFAILLGAAGLAAEFNLGRIFIKDWLIGRRERRAATAARRGALRTGPGPAENAPVEAPHVAPVKLLPIAAAAALTACTLTARAANAVSDAPGPAGVSTSLTFDPGAAGQPTEPAPVPDEPKPLTISTDRPGFSDSSGIAPLWHLQLETGYTFTLRDRDGVESHTHNAPELLARLGLIEDRLEIRIGTSGYFWSRIDDGAATSSVEGFSDAFAGFKLKLIDQDGAIPRLALEGITTLSLGEHDISNREVEPTAKLIASWDLGSGFTLTSNAVLTYTTTSGSRFIQVAGSASLSYSVSDTTSVFVEYFAVGPRIKGSDAAHSIDFGGAYLLNNRVQLDARVGFGLNAEADNVFVGVGISFLF